MPFRFSLATACSMSSMENEYRAIAIHDVAGGPSAVPELVGDGLWLPAEGPPADGDGLPGPVAPVLLDAGPDVGVEVPADVADEGGADVGDGGAAEVDLRDPALAVSAGGAGLGNNGSAAES